MGSRGDNATGDLARYLYRCRRDGREPNKQEAMKFAESEGHSGNTLAKVWRQWAGEGQIKGEATMPDHMDDVPTVHEKLATAKAALDVAWQDLCDWRQFGRLNAMGMFCGTKVPLPDPPQRPTVAGVEATERAIEVIENALAMIAGKRDQGTP